MGFKSKSHLADLDVTKLRERTMEENLQSESIGELSKDLTKVQAQIEPAKRSTKHPHYGHFFATLGDVVDSIKQALGANGFSYVQAGRVDASGRQILRTILIHKSGEWIAGDYLVSNAKPNDAQAAGSGWTYSRRYALSAMLGVVVEDDDGQHASETSSNAKSGSALAGRKLGDAPPPASKPAQPSGDSEGVIRFIPSQVQPPKEFPSGMSYSVKLDGKFYSTKSEAIYNTLMDAQDGKKEIAMGWKANGKYLNITAVKYTSDEPVEEEVAF